ncbi:MAG: transcription factor FapR [Clostridiaceae bacterium]|nr:transcription factor FapR [Clostridiaceae bacterium]
MNKSSLAKKDRHNRLLEIIREDPFMTDEEIAECLEVSIPTVRLDRLELGIPELRQRIKEVAALAHQKVRSLHADEIVGEIVDIQLGENAISILDTTVQMVFGKSRIVRGHYIYSFAESLAIAVIDAEVALVGVANIKYKTPVYAGSRLLAKAEVRQVKHRNHIVWVLIYHKQIEVFRGKFILVTIDDKDKNDDKNNSLK